MRQHDKHAMHYQVITKLLMSEHNLHSNVPTSALITELVLSSDHFYEISTECVGISSCTFQPVFQKHLWNRPTENTAHLQPANKNLPRPLGVLCYNSEISNEQTPPQTKHHLQLIYICAWLCHRCLYKITLHQPYSKQFPQLFNCAVLITIFLKQYTLQALILSRWLNVYD